MVVNDVRRIGKYDVTGTLGEGVHGVVYEGFDPFLKRRLAIKLCTADDADLRRRFYREAEIASRLEHKNVVAVLDFGIEGDRPYLVQELLEGEGLDAVIERRDSLAVTDRLDILIQIARALAYAHAQGVVHRDVRPGNVRLVPSGWVKLMDFGIAKLAAAQSSLTREGASVKQASYLPPEQVRAEKLDHRADIFSFGVLAYELVSFERPFRGNTLSALVYQVLYKVPAPLARVWPDCPRALSDLVEKCLEKKPAERWPSVAEILPELETIRETISDRGVLTHEPAERMDDSGGKIDDTRPVLVVAGDDDDDSAPADTAASPAVDEPVGGRPIGDLPANAEPAAGGSKESTPSLSADGDRVAATLPPAGSELSDDVPTMRLPQVAEAEPPLARRAAEIGTLIAKGELETAMRELEETVQERQDPTREGSRSVAERGSAPPTKPSVRKADAPPTKPSVRKADAPPTKPPVRKADAPPTKPSVPKTAPSAKPKAKKPPAGSGLVRPPVPPKPAGKPRRRRLLLVLVAVLLPCLAVVFILGRRSEQPEPVVESPAPMPEPAAAVVPADSSPDAVIGHLRVVAAPWAEILDIVDVGGRRSRLPADPYAPLVLNLVPGRYRLTLSHPEAEGPVTCEATVASAKTSDCRVSVVEIDAVTYFRLVGWWR